MRVTTRPSISFVFRLSTATYQRYTYASSKYVSVSRGRSTNWIYRSHSRFLSYSTSSQSDDKNGKHTIQKRTYDDAINLLNTLQTPYVELKRQWDAGIIRGAEDLQHTKDCFAELGYVNSDLDKLNIVHVAGTKGKGTVCAYVDFILNQCRLTANRNRLRRPQNIGLYTSPHLISVRERIRINSSPISEELFTKYFFEVWDKLCVPDQSGRPPVTPLPVYFRFLTLMSFHVFISESVDCAIYEVGMGGEYDATNIVEKPAVTGITALGIDHTFHLGKTIDKIAWHKAGIFKKGVAAYTVPQPPKARIVLEERAQEIGTQYLFEAREFNAPVQPQTKFQQQNAGLAIELAKDILNLFNPGKPKLLNRSSNNLLSLPSTFIRGLQGVISRGRCELKVTDNINWYLDGAHTIDSIDIVVQWFHTFKSTTKGPRILLFNQQGHRESMELLERMFAIAEKTGVEFDHVIFCPSLPPVDSVRKDHVNHQIDLQAVAKMIVQRKFAARWLELSANSSNRHHESHVRFLPNLEEAFSYVRNIPVSNAVGEGRRKEEEAKAHVFITGSMHLVGRALSLLEGVDCL